MTKSAFELGKERRRKDQTYVEGEYGEIGKLLDDGTYEVFPDSSTHTIVNVRINGDPNRTVEAINHKVTPKARLPVRMRLNVSKRYEIIDVEPLRTQEFMGDAAPSANIPYLVGDALDVMLNSEHFRPGLVHPETGDDLVFRMEKLVYGDTELGGTVDATTAVGSIASGLKALIVFSVDPTTNTITATKGTDVGLPVPLTRAMALAVTIPAGDVLLWAYIFSEGATTPPTARLPADSDFQFDLRTWITSPGGGSGTVTSVALTAAPSSVFNVSGSPVTTSGTLALSMDDQNANKVLAGPTTGADAAPAFRALVDDDIPAALTLVGGTINNTPIGATTANTGIFSALSLLISTFKGIFTHANSADRTYTFPDYNGTMATLAGAETFTNKTLTTPTIADFTNAQHDHLDTDDGGMLTDSAVALNIKLSCNGASRANVNIASAPATIDGISTTAGRRFLLTGQTTGSQNGIWVSNGSGAAMTRPTDYASGNTIQAYTGIIVFVRGGTLFAGSWWQMVTTGTITIDTSSPVWTLSSGTFRSQISIVNTSSDFAGAIVTPTLSANRQYALADADGTFVFEEVAQTLINKTLTSPTLTTPTIASFTNATHDHTNAAGGGTLSASAITSGTFNEARIPHKYAILQHQENQNVAGGALAATTWTTRPLTTEVSDADSIVSIGSNQFTPIAGTYQIRMSAEIGNGTGLIVRHRLRNITAGSTPTGGISTNSRLNASGTKAILELIFTANGTDAYAIQYFSTGSQATNGLGVAINETGQNEIYMTIFLEKIA